MENKTKPRVFMLGPIAPPMGGMVTSIQNLLYSDLNDKYKFLVFDTTGYRTRHQKGTLINGIFHQLFLFCKLFYYLLAKKPKIAHFNLKGGFTLYRGTADIVLCKLLGCKIIIHMHGSDLDKIGFWGKGFLKFVSCLSNKVIALSKRWKYFFSAIMREGKIEVIPNGVILSDFISKENIKEKLGLSNADALILFLGGISVRKGIFDILEFVSKKKEELGSATFIIAGDLDHSIELNERKEIEKLFMSKINDNKLNRFIKYVGKLEGQEKIDYLLSSDIVLCPSYAENFPNVMLEALAAGRPLVITDVGGIRDVLEDGVNGFIIQPGDVNALAEKTMTLIRDIELRKRMGDANIVLAKQYDMGLVAEKIGECYQELLRL